MEIAFILIGYGDVGKNRFTPALKNYLKKRAVIHFSPSSKEMLNYFIVDIDERKRKEVESLKNECKAENIPIKIDFFNITIRNDLERLLSKLDEYKISLVYIASPNKTHARYIDLFLKKSNRILVEKPLVDNLYELESIERKYNRSDFSIVRLFDHFLFKDSCREFLHNYKRYLSLVGNIKKFYCYLIESDIIRNERAWLYNSGIIRDLAVHFFSILLKLYELGCDVFEPRNFDLKEVKKARYKRKYIPDYIKDPKETFGLLKFNIKNIENICIVGRGLNFNKKEMIIVGEKGTLLMNFLENTIYLIHDGKKDILFEGKSRKHHEYWNLMDRIFNKDPTIGLSYNLAKEEIRLSEKTDTVKISKIYDIGELPFKECKNFLRVGTDKNMESILF